jgi:hypothetical protein
MSFSQQRSGFGELAGWFESFERRKTDAPIRTLEPLSPLMEGSVPCDGCHLWNRCAERRLACERFSRFLAGKAWEGTPAEPDRQRWLAIYDEPKIHEEQNAPRQRAI